jgi:hypothetical protein
MVEWASEQLTEWETQKNDEQGLEPLTCTPLGQHTLTPDPNICVSCHEPLRDDILPYHTCTNFATQPHYATRKRPAR